MIDYIEQIELCLGMKANKKFMDIQPREVYATFLDYKALEEWINFKPSTIFKDGITRLIEWYRNYHKNENI